MSTGWRGEQTDGQHVPHHRRQHRQVLEGLPGEEDACAHQKGQGDDQYIVTIGEVPWEEEAHLRYKTIITLITIFSQVDKLKDLIQGRNQQQQRQGTRSKDAPVASPPPGWLLSVTRDLAQNDSWMSSLVKEYL